MTETAHQINYWMSNAYREVIHVFCKDFLGMFHMPCIDRYKGDRTAVFKMEMPVIQAL